MTLRHNRRSRARAAPQTRHPQPFRADQVPRRRRELTRDRGGTSCRCSSKEAGRSARRDGRAKAHAAGAAGAVHSVDGKNRARTRRSTCLGCERVWFTPGWREMQSLSRLRCRRSSRDRTSAAITVSASSCSPRDALGTYEALVPRLHLKSRIFAASQLNSGPAWWPITGRPGGGENIAVAGHRTTHSRPFYFLERLQRGDRIQIVYLGRTYAYRVARSRVISANDLHIADAVGNERLVLSACTPRGSAQFRLVVEALPGDEAARLASELHSALNKNDRNGIRDMKHAPKNANDQTAGDTGRADRDDSAMSPAMRQLILSFGKADSEPTWNPDAYARRPKHAELPRQMQVDASDARSAGP